MELLDTFILRLSLFTFLLIFLPSPTHSGYLKDLGTVHLKGSIGIGIKPAKEGWGSSDDKGWVCCKGALKLLGEKLFGQKTTFKAQIVAGKKKKPEVHHYKGHHHKGPHHHDHHHHEYKTHDHEHHHYDHHEPSYDQGHQGGQEGYAGYEHSPPQDGPSNPNALNGPKSNSNPSQFQHSSPPFILDGYGNPKKKQDYPKKKKNKKNKKSHKEFGGGSNPFLNDFVPIPESRAPYQQGPPLANPQEEYDHYHSPPSSRFPPNNLPNHEDNPNIYDDNPHQSQHAPFTRNTNNYPQQQGGQGQVEYAHDHDHYGYSFQPGGVGGTGIGGSGPSFHNSPQTPNSFNQHYNHHHHHPNPSYSGRGYPPSGRSQNSISSSPQTGNDFHYYEPKSAYSTLPTKLMNSSFRKNRTSSDMKSSSSDLFRFESGFSPSNGSPEGPSADPDPKDLSLPKELPKEEDLSKMDFKYKVYEYGDDEILELNAEGTGGNVDNLVKASVYSKDNGKLLRTVEIKDPLVKDEGTSLKKSRRRRTGGLD